MRIVGGRFKGKALAAPPGSGTRPTSDRAREATFNILEHAPWSPGVAGRRVIDLFAGTGALGLEALSRGAEKVLFVETDMAARVTLKTNVEACGALGETRVWKRDAAALEPMPSTTFGPFDLAFLDPPYGRGLAALALARLSDGWLSDGAIVVVETARGEPLDAPAGFTPLDARDYGAATLRFFVFARVG